MAGGRVFTGATPAPASGGGFLPTGGQFNVLQAALGDRASRVTLVKDLGETFVEGRDRLDRPRWNWGKR